MTDRLRRVGTALVRTERQAAGVADRTQQMSEFLQVPGEEAGDAVVFDVVTRGYARRQVDAHVDALQRELAELRRLHEDLAAQRQALAAQREEQQRWTPSFSALGPRAVEILHLAEQEAAALLAEAAREVRQAELEAAAELAALRAEHERTLEEDRAVAERDRRALVDDMQTRRDQLEVELSDARRAAELEVAGQLGQAAAQAQDVRAAAAREAEQMLATARAEVTALQSRRDALASELRDLADRLVAVVHRLDRPSAS